MGPPGFKSRWGRSQPLRPPRGRWSRRRFCYWGGVSMDPPAAQRWARRRKALGHRKRARGRMRTSSGTRGRKSRVPRRRARGNLRVSHRGGSHIGRPVYVSRRWDRRADGLAKGIRGICAFRHWGESHFGSPEFALGWNPHPRRPCTRRLPMRRRRR